MCQPNNNNFDSNTINITVYTIYTKYFGGNLLYENLSIN